MAITGTFNTFDNKDTYSVTIGTTFYHTTITDTTESYDDSETVIMFDPNPVTITADRGDLQKRIIISQATINLVSNSDLTEGLFASTNRDIPVTIEKGGVTVFFGYVDPLQFNQGYAYNWEKIQVNATDPLGALEDLKIGQLPDVDQSSTMTSCELIEAILDAANIDTVDYSGVNQTVKAAMDTTNIKLSVFFGESEDDWMSLYETLEEICKYFNLYIAYYGGSAHVTCTINNTPQEFEIQSFKNAAADSSTALSTDEAYTQASLTCEIEPEDSLLTPIDDKDYLYSDYDNSEVYMTELIAEGEGTSAFNSFKELCMTGNTTWEAGYKIDNSVYIMKNAMWDFGPQGYTKQNFEYQRDILTWLKSGRGNGKGAILGFGRGNKVNAQDNSIPGEPEITPYFVISTNGEYNNTDAGAGAMQTKIKDNIPICEYVGLSSSILSPSDPNITNYICISGNIFLNPLQKLTGPNWATDHDKINNTVSECQSIFNQGSILSTFYLWHHTVPNPNNDDGAYYQQVWVGNPGIYGNLDNSKNKELKYEYSSVGSDADTISKLPIIACMLVVGDAPKETNDAYTENDKRKYCVEDLSNGGGVFTWKTYTECAAGDNEMPAPYNRITFFTLGCDPKKDDYIIGQSYPISNTKPGITGTAIPVKSTDELAGKIEFKILGPYNSIWEEITRIHPSFWRHTRWESESKPILQNIQSIMISNLKVEVKANTGISELKTSADNDLVYASDTNPSFIEKLEDNIKICTPLTLEECEQFGIKYQVSDSYIYTTDNQAFRGFDTGQQGPVGPQGVQSPIYIKPEQCLVDYYYKEYVNAVNNNAIPARIISTSLRSSYNNGNNTIYPIGPQGPYGQMLNADMLNTYITGLPIEGNYRIMSYEADLKGKKIDFNFREHRTTSNPQI